MLREAGLKRGPTSHQVCKSKEFSYTIVNCSCIWLVKRTKSGFESTGDPARDMFLRQLEHLSVPQPEYDKAVDLNDNSGGGSVVAHGSSYE
jgi:hypothetical protein